jgi:hypothetical protein
MKICAVISEGTSDENHVAPPRAFPRGATRSECSIGCIATPKSPRTERAFPKCTVEGAIVGIYAHQQYEKRSAGRDQMKLLSNVMKCDGSTCKISAHVEAQSLVETRCTEFAVVIVLLEKREACHKSERGILCSVLRRRVPDRKYKQSHTTLCQPCIHSGNTPSSTLQLSQHLPRRTQTLTIPINRRNQAPIKLRKLPLQHLHVLVMLVLAPRCLITLHHLNLMRAVLAGGKS